MTVETLLPAVRPCVLASVAIDLTAVTVGAPQTYPQWYVALVPAAANDVNPTHWALADDGFESSGNAPQALQACATG